MSINAKAMEAQPGIKCTHMFNDLVDGGAGDPLARVNQRGDEERLLTRTTAGHLKMVSNVWSCITSG